MSEFSRRVDVEIIKDEPMTLDEFTAAHPDEVGEALPLAYGQYLARFQPYRWRAVAANNEPVAHGESYFNEVGCLNAIELNYADDTTMYWARTYGEDRGERLLRYGVTDRDHQAAATAEVDGPDLRKIQG